MIFTPRKDAKLASVHGKSILITLFSLEPFIYGADS